MLNRIDTFFIKAGTASTFFFIDFERQFPPGLHIHATNSLSRVAQAGPKSSKPSEFRHCEYRLIFCTFARWRRPTRLSAIGRPERDKR